MEPTISIITINFNGVKDTLALLKSISPTEELEMIVVDNGSKEDEASIIEQAYPYVVVVRSKTNLGFAGGNNLGYQASHGKYIFFVNNDTEFPSDCDFSPLINRLEASNSIGMVCPKIRFFWGSRPIQFAGFTPLSKLTLRNRSIGFNEEDHGQYDYPHPTPYAHGAAMLVKREAIESVGIMPECFFLYYEELDWSMLFTRSGYSIWYDPSCTIYHKESQTTGQGSPLRSYYITRNRLLFAKRNLPMPRRWLTYGYLIFAVGIKDIAKHLMTNNPKLAKATISGITDFLRGRSGYRLFL